MTLLSTDKKLSSEFVLALLFFSFIAFRISVNIGTLDLDHLDNVPMTGCPGFTANEAYRLVIGDCLHPIRPFMRFIIMRHPVIRRAPSKIPQTFQADLVKGEVQKQDINISIVAIQTEPIHTATRTRKLSIGNRNS